MNRDKLRNPTLGNRVWATFFKQVGNQLLQPATVLLSPNVLVFAILETFILLTVSLLLCGGLESVVIY